MKCLSCNGEIREYRTAKLVFWRTLGGYSEKGYALAECPSCGHCELVANGSRLLDGMVPAKFAAGE